MKMTVDPPELKKASGELNRIAGDYTDIYNRLITTARTMGDAWKAADNLAYVEQINGFCDDLKQMADHLTLASETLMKQAVNYETNRDNNISGVRQLTN
ncbi:MAG: WXG100 family type VII secretion target [Lachnospiraceae bacterium]|nr:WXG100 family type VII secretion target [Lachnospiraceae bacterium]